METTYGPIWKTSMSNQNVTISAAVHNSTYVGGTIGIAVGIAVMALIVVSTTSVTIFVYRRRKQRAAAEARSAEQNPHRAVESNLWSTEHSKHVPASSLSTNSICEIGHPHFAPAASTSCSSSLDYYASKSSGLHPAGEPSDFLQRHNHEHPVRSAPKNSSNRSSRHGLRAHCSDVTRISGTDSLHNNMYAAVLSEPIENLSSSPRASMARRSGDGPFGISPADRWRSMASADSGLASSLASFADADHSHPGPISSRYSFSSYESLATPAAYATATALTLTSSRSACHDGSCRSPSCIRCSKALTSLDEQRLQQQAPDIVEETGVGCTLETIQELVRQFEELRLAGQVSVRSVYCTPSFAIADLDESGGCLITGDRSCSLTVPAGALARRQTVYFGVIYESSSSDSGAEVWDEANFTPTFECGPDGLRFLKPVQLRTHHCVGPGSDLGQVTAFVREGGRTDWSDDSDAGVTYDGEKAVLSLTHFTGYKLATNLQSSRGAGAVSRIPRPVAQQPPLMKELYLCSFRCDGKVRVYYMDRDDALFDKLYAQELGLGNTLNSPKKPFSFIYNYGDLLMHTIHGARRKFECRGVMSNNYNYAEMCKIEGVSSFDIHIQQENGGDSSCIIVATFDSHGRTRNDVPVMCEFLSESTLQPLTLSESITARRPSCASDNATLLPSVDRRSSSSLKGGVAAATGRSPQADGVTGSGSLSLTLSSPAESCECEAHGAAAEGAAGGCCHAYLCRFRSGRCLSPGEHSDDSTASSFDSAQPTQLHRDRRTRLSKESGYASVSSFADLQGPQTMSASEVLARGTTPQAGFAQPEKQVSRRAPDERRRPAAAEERTHEPCHFPHRQPPQPTAENSQAGDHEENSRSHSFGQRSIRKPQPLPRSSRYDS